jgi:hypothetical protein
MGSEKKQWIKPQLIVLARGTPEESVLAGCKSKIGEGPNSDYDPLLHCHQPACSGVGLS